MITLPSALALIAKLTARFRFAAAATWLRWLVMFTGVAVAVTGCKMMG